MRPLSFETRAVAGIEFRPRRQFAADEQQQDDKSYLPPASLHSGAGHSARREFDASRP